MSEQPYRSALHERHVALEARMADEAGWEVPLSYRGVLDEVRELRRRAGVLDLSHFGRIRIRGGGALDLLERLCTADVARQEDDTTLETLLCNESGGVMDLCRLIRLESFWVLVTSPPCREKVLAHAQALAEQFDAKVDDQTFKTSLLAVEGPEAAGILDAVLPFKASAIADGAVKFGSLMIARYIAERTSFSGEWGVQVQVPNMLAGQAWRFITASAGTNALPPVGLAAWDVLRIEAGRPRYGHELNETVDPFCAGLERLLDLEHDFLGQDVLEKLRACSAASRLVGLVLLPDEPPETPPPPGSIPHLGEPVLAPDGSEVGQVTSGTYSAAMEKTIAMAQVASDSAAPGTRLRVGARSAEAVELPFRLP